MVYEWKTGYHSTVKAEVFAEVAEKLAKENRLSAKEVVNASRSEQSPLHCAFEWDDAIAGEKWREQQARVMIASIVCRVEEAPVVEPIRAFYQIDKTTSNYESTITIMSSKEKRDMLFDLAMSELRAFKRKYAEIKEFSGLFAVIDDLERGA